MARHGRGKRGHEQTRKVIHKQSRKRVSNIHVGAPLDDLDDDIDKFHKGSDKIPLDMNDDSELSPDEREEPIFNLKADGSEEDDDMEDDLDDEQLSGLAAKIAKQAKMLRQKRSLTEDEEDDEGGNEKERKAAWGKRKNMYYSADNVDYELQSSDEEAPAEEEAEALRLQRLKAESLRPEDFELDEEDDVVAPLEVHEHTLQEIVERQEAEDKKEKQHLSPKSCRIGGFGEDAKVLVEEVKKDIQALSKEEQMSVVMRLMRGLDDFDDEVPDFVEWKQKPLGGKILNDCSKPRKLSQVIAEAGQRSKKLKVLSGDADLPAKADLGERRSKLEMQNVSKFHDGEEGVEEEGDIDLNEDEFYQAAKQMKDAKYAAKALVYSRAPSAAPEVEAESGKRHISYQMEKNKGLTPHRKKLTKNPRKKYKVKHQKAVIRRKGQVREVKLPHGPYGGETTGIRTNISRSIRFQS